MNVPTAPVALALHYVAHFTDGSSSLIEIRGSYGRCDLIGIATRGDGKRRVIFFKTHGWRGRDPWVHSVTACEAYDARVQAKLNPLLSVVA